MTCMRVLTMMHSLMAVGHGGESAFASASSGQPREVYALLLMYFYPDLYVHAKLMKLVKKIGAE